MLSTFKTPLLILIKYGNMCSSMLTHVHFVVRLVSPHIMKSVTTAAIINNHFVPLIGMTNKITDTNNITNIMDSLWYLQRLLLTAQMGHYILIQHTIHWVFLIWEKGVLFFHWDTPMVMFGFKVMITCIGIICAITVRGPLLIG
jgi:hypothetical protein